MPHYGKQTLKHISTMKLLQGWFKYSLYTCIHSQSMQQNFYKISLWDALYGMHRTKQPYLLWLGTWSWFGARSWFGLGTAARLWPTTAVAPAPTATTTSAMGPIIKCQMTTICLQLQEKPTGLQHHCSEHVGKFTTYKFWHERNHHSNLTLSYSGFA